MGTGNETITGNEEVIHDKESGTGLGGIAPNQADVVPPEEGDSEAGVLEKYSHLAQEPIKLKESRVRAYNFRPKPTPSGWPKWGGCPKNATGADGMPLLVPVPTVEGKPQQLLHRLAATRLAALNEKWLREHPDKEELKLCSGWRKNAFIGRGGEPDKMKFHEYCAGKGRWLNTGQYGLGPASPENLPGGKEGRKSCSRFRAFISPHETGLAMDFGNNGLTANSDLSGQKDTVLYKWLTANAHLFGITPLLHEAWHWEVNVPLEAWINGTEFVTGNDYAVRIKGQGKQGKIGSGVGSGAGGGRGGAPCHAKSTLGEEEKEKILSIKDYGVMEPQVGVAKPGTKFPGLRTRDPSKITSIVIHDTAGGFGKIPGPPGVPGEKENRCILTLVNRGYHVHFTIDQFGEVRQHAKIEEVTSHAGGVNGVSIGIEFVNPVYLSKDRAAKIAKKSSIFPIIKMGKIFATKKPYFIANTKAACEAAYQLIRQLTSHEKCKNLKHVYPCTVDTFTHHTDSRWKNGGIFSHRKQNSNKSDGMFGEWYCASRLAGNGPEAAWVATMSAYIEKSEGSKATDPYPLPSSYSGDSAKVSRALAEARSELLEGKEGE